MAKAVEAQEKAEALPKSSRPPPWRDKFVQQRFFVVAWNPVQRHEARSQEGVMNFYVCLKLINSLWEAFEMKAQSPEKFMDVSDVKVTDEGGSLQCSKTIKANNKIVKERIWINPVTSMIETQPLETDTDAQLHDERIITVREEPGLHVNPTIEMSQNVWTYSRSSRLHVRMSKKSGWNREEHSH